MCVSIEADRSHVFLIVVLLAVAAPLIFLTVIWMDAASAIERAERDGLVERRSGPLSIVEETAAFSEFGGSWDVSERPCRTLRDIARAIAAQGQRAPYGSVATRFAGTMLQMQSPERSLRRHLTEAAVACQLEQRYDDTSLLRAWLDRASFGEDAHGIEAAAQSIIGKDAAALSAYESAQLIALLKGPSIRSRPEQWAERSGLIAERVAERRGQSGLPASIPAP